MVLNSFTFLPALGRALQVANIKKKRSQARGFPEQFGVERFVSLISSNIFVHG